MPLMIKLCLMLIPILVVEVIIFACAAGVYVETNNEDFYKFLTFMAKLTIYTVFLILIAIIVASFWFIFHVL